jgi:outer membrane immunogenic protein
MLRKFLLASVALAAFATTASAADMAARMPTKAVPYVSAAYNWTGFYVGANVGYGWARASDDLGAVTGRLNGVIGGGQIGYNWQMNNLVLGFETDFQGSGQSQSWSAVGPGFTAASGTDRIRYFGTVRGRLGFAFDRTLLYVTGGYAYTNVGADASFTGLGGGTTSGSSNSTKSGYTVGAGLEYAFAGPWSAKVEYLYIDSGSQSVSSGVFTDNVRIRNNIGRVGLNYRF